MTEIESRTKSFLTIRLADHLLLHTRSYAAPLGRPASARLSRDSSGLKWNLVLY